MLALALTRAAAGQNDDCSGALPAGNGFTVGTNVAAATSTATACGIAGSDVWYRYVAPCSGTVFASFCPGGAGATYDTVLALFSGVCGALVPLACNDDACGPHSDLLAPVTAGETYYLSVGGKGGAKGTFVLLLDCQPAPLNDGCAGAAALADGLVAGSTTGALTHTSATCGTSYGDVWYRYVPQATGFARFSTCAPGATALFDSIMIAYRGYCGRFTEVACNDDACGLRSDLVLPVFAGEPILLSVGGYNGVTGDFSLYVNTTAADLQQTELLALQPGSATSTVLRVNTIPAAVAVAGAAGAKALSGLARSPVTGACYASSGFADGGKLYALDPASGAVALIGSTGFSAVAGLAFDGAGVLYGTAATAPNGVTSVLIRIDLASGAGTAVGPFGASGTTIDGLDGLGFDPTSGLLIAVSGASFDGSPGDVFSIVPATGAASKIGELIDADTGQLPQQTVSGLEFTKTGTLYASLGGGHGGILLVDAATWRFRQVVDAADSSVSALASLCPTNYLYGAGCPGSDGLVPRLLLRGCSQSGESLEIQVRDGFGGAPALLLFGLLRAALPLGGGCDLEVTPILPAQVVLALPGAGSGAGDLDLSSAIPPLPSLTLTMQCWIADPGAPRGFTATNGVEVHVNL